MLVFLSVEIVGVYVALLACAVLTRASCVVDWTLLADFGEIGETMNRGYLLAVEVGRQSVYVDANLAVVEQCVPDAVRVSRVWFNIIRPFELR